MSEYSELQRDLSLRQFRVCYRGLKNACLLTFAVICVSVVEETEAEAALETGASAPVDGGGVPETG